jgi:hypothetical protein
MLQGFVLGSVIMAALFGGAYGVVGALSAKPWQLFHTNYVSFSMPPEWACELGDGAFVCAHPDTTRARESVIILAAKRIGPMDTLDQYEAHLSQPRPIVPDADGAPVVYSQIKQIGRQQIGEGEWVVGKHLGSEIPGYYTTYLGGIVKDIAILITFSYHQSMERRYEPYGARIARSITVTL